MRRTHHISDLGSHHYLPTNAMFVCLFFFLTAIVRKKMILEHRVYMKIIHDHHLVVQYPLLLAAGRSLQKGIYCSWQFTLL